MALLAALGNLWVGIEFWRWAARARNAAGRRSAGRALFWLLTAALPEQWAEWRLVTTFITAFKVFDTVAVMTRGGPMGSSEVLLYAVYLEGFQYFHLGYAATLTLIFLAFTLVFSVAQTFILDRKVHY